MSRKKIIILAVVILLTCTTAFFLINKKSAEAPVNNPKTEKAAIKTKTPDKIRLIASGDNLPHETVNAEAKRGDKYDYAQFFKQINPIFNSSDIAFCNQESPSAPNLSVSAYPTFNAPKEFAQDLSKVGCNVIGLANNHLNDKGQSGINGTRALWDQIKPLAVAGANRNSEEQNKVAYFDVKGLKFAFVAYSEISNSSPSQSFSLNRFDEKLIKSQLSEASAKADFTIVSAHWGTEYSPSANPAQEKWAKIFADNGADIVFGTGPHVLQPVKKLAKSVGGETIVFYSLGNLLSSQLDVESLIGGLAVLDIDTASKKITNIGFFPTYMHYEWTPAEKSRQDLLARHNLMIYPLDQAEGPLAKSQNNTTVQAQTKRITDLLNKYTQVKILKYSDFN